VVAHTLSVVTFQAGVGRKIGATRPAEALLALRAVEVTGRSALEELRRILGPLRDDDGEAPSLVPAPGSATSRTWPAPCGPPGYRCRWPRLGLMRNGQFEQPHEVPGAGTHVIAARRHMSHKDPFSRSSTTSCWRLTA
jgi:Histidine kinase